MSKIGLKKPVAAIILEDTNEKTIYETPFSIGKAISASISPSINKSTRYADDNVSDVAITLGEIEVSFELDDLEPQIVSKLLGIERDENGILHYTSTINAPYVALGFESALSKPANAKRYVWLTKGVFSMGADEYSTKAGEAEFKNETITGTFMVRESDDEWKIQVDSHEVPEGKETILENWFNVPFGGELAQTNAPIDETEAGE